MHKLPRVRSANIVTQDLDNEILIYDLTTNKAFHLNKTSTIIFKACEGAATFRELKNKYKFTDDLIFLALDDLKRENLIEPEEIFASPLAGMSRREVVRKVGLASALALPLISALVVPTAVQAASCLGDGQTDCNITPCCPGLSCVGGIVGGFCVPLSVPPVSL